MVNATIIFAKMGAFRSTTGASLSWALKSAGNTEISVPQCAILVVEYEKH